MIPGPAHLGAAGTWRGHFYTIRDGQIVSLRDFFDTAALAEALAPPDPQEVSQKELFNPEWSVGAGVSER